MAIVYPYVLKCGCGESVTANLADGVNVSRTPEARDAIVSGRFHRVSCSSCKKTVTAEKSFFYTDLDRGTFIQVKPRQDRHLWRSTSQSLTRAVARVPEELTRGGRKLRVVFGMAELREKLIAEDLGLDDRAVELLKVALLNEHPFLLHRPRLRLVLDGATQHQMNFIASYDLDDVSFALAVAREAALEFTGEEEKLQEWTRSASKRAPLFELKDDHWVNMWRWSPQPGALEALKEYGGKVRRGEELDLESPELRRMLAGLPAGAQLPGWAKQDLQVLFNYAKERGHQALQDTLFEIRFSKTLADDWSTNEEPEDIDTLWKLLEELPPSNVEGNVSIRSLNLAQGEGGGWYEPQTGDIYIGSRLLSDREDFEDVLRHEVGHGIHEARLDEVNTWLAETFGWQMFAPDRAGLESWIALMGGWDRFHVPDQQRGDVLRYLNVAIGNGSSWDPGPAPNVPAGHSWWDREFGPRLAYERSGGNWYMNHASWYRAEGRAFFLNFYYRTLCVVNEETLALVARMPSSYAAMSTFEFFAEMYALYYDEDDPLRQVLPAQVGAWLDQLGTAMVSRMPVRPREREEFETVTRPRGK